MSLQRYIFLVIGLFIVLFSIVQYYSIEQVKEQINEEIRAKSTTISQVALSTLSEKLPQKLERLLSERSPQMLHKFTRSPQSGVDQPVTKEVTISIKTTPNQHIKLDDGLIFVTGNDTKTVEVITQQTAPKATEHKELPQTMPDDLSKVLGSLNAASIQVRNVDKAYAVEFDFIEQDGLQKIVSFNSEGSSIDQYFSMLYWQLLLVTFIALFFAYWLAKHISRPLSTLSFGFKRLNQGKLGEQLPEVGVKEMRATLAQFNHTSSKLHQLQQIEKAYSQQQQMAELGEVARGLAHTLRNPLNTIGLGVSQIQTGQISDNDKQNIAEQIQQKIRQLDATIKNLMHLAGSDLQRTTVVELAIVVNDLILEISLGSKAKIEFKHDSDTRLVCAEAEIRAMFHALISNAIEATDMPQVIKIDLQQSHNGIDFSVMDEGEGISDSIKDDIFKPHVTSKANGAGMGLFIVKRISEMYYNGSIVVNSMEQGGCSVKLCLQNAQNEKTQSTDGT